MTISHVLLTMTFGQWVDITNELVDKVNVQLDDTVLNTLLTSDKTSLVGAINELYNDKYDKTGGPISGNVTVAGTLQADGPVTIGKDTGGDSVLEFYDDTNNTTRQLFWDDSSSGWFIEDSGGVNQPLFHGGREIDLGDLTVANTNTLMQFRRGTTAENDAYTGNAGEITIDTDLNQLRLHDGSTAGGITFAASATFDIDALPALGTLQVGDLVAVSDQSDSGAEKKVTLTDLFAQAESLGLTGFDIDALTALTNVGGNDLVAVSDFSAGGEEKKVTLNNLITSMIATGDIGSFEIVNSSLGADGYMEFSNGVIIQWGSFSAPNGGNTAELFPIAFPNNVWAVSTGEACNFYGINVAIVDGTVSTTGFTVNNSSSGGATIYYLAIGN